MTKPERLLLLEPGGGPAMARYSAGLLAALAPDYAIARATARHIEPRGPLQRRWGRDDSSLSSAGTDFNIVHATQIFLSPHLRRFPGARVITVHDFMPRRFSRNWPRRAFVYRRVFERSRRNLRNADLVITPSEFTRRELLAAGPCKPEQVLVVPPALPAEMCSDPAAERLERTILSVGPTFAYKNVPLLLHAFAQPPLRDTRLVRIGRFRSDHRELAVELGVMPRIQETGYVPDEELVRWYRTATVLAHPSYSEGFGLPVAEAMLCGLPVVVSDGGALPEVAGTAGRIVPLRSRHPRSPVNVDDVRDFAEALAEVLADARGRAEMSASGIEDAKRFRLDSVRPQLLTAYGRAKEIAIAR